MRDITIWKSTAETIVNIMKAIEELDPTARVLPDFRRRLQFDGYSCGLQCVGMVLEYFGTDHGEMKLARRSLDEGTPTSDIKRALKAHGLKFSIKNHARITDLRRAIDAGCPAIVSTRNDSHWTVVYGYADGHVFVADPAIWINPFVRVPVPKFKLQWDRWMMEIRRAAE